MHWKVLTPWWNSGGSADDWIPGQISPPTQHFDVVPAPYIHDPYRSRKNTSTKQWCDYLLHALWGWLTALRVREEPVGFVTAFPQLAVTVGLIKRVSRSRAPVLAWCYNMGKTYEGLKGRLARFSLRGIDLFVVHSRKEIQTYSEWLGLPPDRFVFVPLSVALIERTKPEDEDNPFVLAMGTANRDYRSLIDALEPLEYPTIIVAGEHAMAGLHVPKNVQIRSGLTIHECHDLCERARVNVIPVRNQTTASGQVTLLEAMMFGKAIVASRCPGTEDYVQDGVTGVLFPPGDIVALREAIRALWTDSALRQRLGSAAREYAVYNFTFRSVAPHMADLIGRLEAGARAGRKRD